MAEPLERLKSALSSRYAVERELGSGGMATVYLALDLKHHRKVAVKASRSRWRTPNSLVLPFFGSIRSGTR